jgi:hypothetical protein
MNSSRNGFASFMIAASMVPLAGAVPAAWAADTVAQAAPLASVKVPNVVGDTQTAATTALTKVDLKLGTVTTASSATIAAGLVISESPAAGTSVTSGSAVKLTISSGKPKVDVPNVVDDTQAAATTALTKAGLKLGAVTTESSVTIKAGLVISESPVAGTLVASGSAVNLTVSSGAPAVAELVTERALAQTGLAIGLASTVLQSQIEIVFAATDSCSKLTGGGSTLVNSSVMTSPTTTTAKVTVYYDSDCKEPYIVAQAKETEVTGSSGSLSLSVSETATYYGLKETEIGTLKLTASTAENSAGTSIVVHGLGIFTPTSGAKTPVQLGLYCTLPLDGGTIETVPCAGGIAQNFPALDIALGAVTPLTLKINSESEEVTFSGTGSTVDSGALGSLTLTAPSATSMLITGGKSIASYSSSGSAAQFALFPPTPTAWSLKDAVSGLEFQIQVVSNTTRNLTFTISKGATGTALATGAIDQSGTGKVTYSDGSSASITNWTLAD